MPACHLVSRRVVINTGLTVPPARVVLNEQTYVTAPVVMVVEGVLNGGLIPGDELHPQMWDGAVVTIGHPETAAGTPQSARQPEVLATCGVGHLFRVQRSTATRQGHPVVSLRGELWINLADVPRCGPEAAQAVAMLEAQHLLNVSTAFYSDAERAVGSFYGTPYTEIHHNLQPDHLALLPNAIGACSLEDGCGAPRLNHATLTYAACACPPGHACQCQEGETPMEESRPRGWRGFVQLLRDFVTQEAEPEEDPPVLPPAEEPVEEAEVKEDEEALVTQQTDADIRESVYGCLAREMGVAMTPIFLDSIDASAQTFTYRQGERLCRRSWTMNDGVLELSSDVEEVQRVTDYVPVPGTSGPAATTHPEEVYPMAQMVTNVQKTRVNRLIANGARTGWTEDDRSRLEAMDEATLIRLEQLAGHTPPQGEPTTLEEALARVPAQFRETLANATQAYTRRKAQLIGILTANTQCPFTEDELQTMEADRLESLVVMAGEALPDPGPRPAHSTAYQGRRMPQLRIVTDDADAVPPLPRTMEAVVERQRALGLRA